MQPLPNSQTHMGVSRRHPRRNTLLAGIALIVVAALLLGPPHALLDKADRAAYAVCHRLASHSFTIAGRPLPLCARCSGTYLGTLVGLSVLLARGRGHANRFPPRRFMAVFALFLALWAVDGFNSYLTLFTGATYLYEPQNLLRLVTGTLEGLVIAAFVLPLFNLSAWAHDPYEAAQPSLSGWPDLWALLAGGAVVVGLVGSEWPPLLYPLALASGVMIVTLVSLIAGIFVLMILRRDGQARGWREIAGPLSTGLAIGLLLLTAIGWVRDALTIWLGLPF